MILYALEYGTWLWGLAYFLALLVAFWFAGRPR